MKHHANDRFTCVRKDRMVNVLKDLLRDYSSLYRELTPEGLRNSAYYEMYSTTGPTAYRVYREGRAFAYKMNRKKYRLNGKIIVPQIGGENRFDGPGKKTPYHIPDLLSYEEFVQLHSGTDPDTEHVAITLYVECLNDILNGRPIVYDSGDRCYYSQIHEFKTLLWEAALVVLPEHARILEPGSPGISVKKYIADRTPIFEFIYKLLLERGLDVMFTKLDPKVFQGITEHLTKLNAEVEADRILFTDYGDRDIDQVEEERRNKIERQRQRNPPYVNPMIEAYHNVYGKLMEDYRYSWK